MKNNPTELDYEYLVPCHAPRYGVTTNHSLVFSTASRYTTAWFVDLIDAQAWAYRKAGHVWDLVNGVRA